MNPAPPPAEYKPPPADILSSLLTPTPAPESTVADTPITPEPQQETPQEVPDMFFINAAALLEEMKREECALPEPEEVVRQESSPQQPSAENLTNNPHQWDF